MDISQLSSRMQLRKTQFRSGANAIVRAVINAADEEAVKTTPVDTGMARSNWVVTVGSPFNDIIPAYAPYPKYSGPKLGEQANAEAAIGQGKSASALFSIDATDIAYLQNNAEYIGKLNDGTQSAQSSNMVEFALLAALEKIRTSPVIFVG